MLYIPPPIHSKLPQVSTHNKPPKPHSQPHPIPEHTLIIKLLKPNRLPVTYILIYLPHNRPKRPEIDPTTKGDILVLFTHVALGQLTRRALDDLALSVTRFMFLVMSHRADAS